MKKDKNKNLLPGGVKGNKGGSGRPPEWLKDKCKDIVDRCKLVEFLGDVASGKPIEEIPNPSYNPHKPGGESQTLMVPASVKDRLSAVEKLMDRGWGKPALSVEHTGKDGGSINLVHAILEERKKRGLPPL